jgi:hypothetical protein
VHAVAVAEGRQGGHRAGPARGERIPFVLGELLEERTRAVGVPRQEPRQRSIARRFPTVLPVRILGDVGVERIGGLLPARVEQLQLADEERGLVAPGSAGVLLAHVTEGDDRFFVAVGAGERAGRAEGILSRVGASGGGALREDARGVGVLPAAVEGIPFRAQALQRGHSPPGGVLDAVDGPRRFLRATGERKRFAARQELVGGERLAHREARERGFRVLPPR